MHVEILIAKWIVRQLLLQEYEFLYKPGDLYTAPTYVGMCKLTLYILSHCIALSLFPGPYSLSMVFLNIGKWELSYDIWVYY